MVGLILGLLKHAQYGPVWADAANFANSEHLRNLRNPRLPENIFGGQVRAQIRSPINSTINNLKTSCYEP